MRLLVVAGCAGLVACGPLEAGEENGDGLIESSVTTLCPQRPACEVPLLLPATTPWRHFSSYFFVGSPRHRGRDLFLREGAPAWALGKFAYGWSDRELKDEDVVVYLLKDCKGPWIEVATQPTTRDGDHAAVEGVKDSGGRVYTNLGTLGAGRHKVRMVVKGDNSYADQFIEVLPNNARVAVSDVDGTLTTEENAQLKSLFNGNPPAESSGAPAVLKALSDAGFYIFYLTARPDWLHTRTHEWLSLRGFPRGLVHTSLSFTGLTGDAAANFKTNELAALKASIGLTPEYGMGNTAADVTAYGAANVTQRYFYQFDPGLSGTRVDDYNALVPTLKAVPAVCP
ncbi:MAG: LNS2 domain-containing protein [Myxococcaceae bacterium]